MCAAEPLVLSEARVRSAAYMHPISQFIVKKKNDNMCD